MRVRSPRGLDSSYQVENHGLLEPASSMAPRAASSWALPMSRTSRRLESFLPYVACLSLFALVSFRLGVDFSHRAFVKPSSQDKAGADSGHHGQRRSHENGWEEQMEVQMLRNSARLLVPAWRRLAQQTQNSTTMGNNVTDVQLAVYTATINSMALASSRLGTLTLVGGPMQTYNSNGMIASMIKTTPLAMGGTSIDYRAALFGGQVTGAMPQAFSAWCLRDALCKAQAELALEVDTYQTPAVFTDVTYNWGPAMFKDTTRSLVAVVSPVVDVQLAYGSSSGGSSSGGSSSDGSSSGGSSSSDPKRDAVICSATSPCSANITLPLSNADPAMRYECMRLEASSGGSGGLIATSLGMTTVSDRIGSYQRCITNRFGKHVVVQFKAGVTDPQVASSPPPRPSPVPGSSAAGPSPPPAPFASGAGDYSGLQVKLVVKFNLNFTVLEGDPLLQELFKQDLRGALATNLAKAFPALLSAQGLPDMDRVQVVRIEPGSIVVTFAIRTPGGSTSLQLGEIRDAIMADVRPFFGGSVFQNSILDVMEVTVADYVDLGGVTPSSSSKLSKAIIIVIAVCGALGLLLLLALIVWLIRYRRRQQILPQPRSMEIQMMKGELKPGRRYMGSLV